MKYVIYLSRVFVFIFFFIEKKVYGEVDERQQIGSRGMNRVKNSLVCVYLMCVGNKYRCSLEDGRMWYN